MLRTSLSTLFIAALSLITGVPDVSAGASPDTTIECAHVDLTSVLAVKLAMWGAPGLKLRSAASPDSSCGPGVLHVFEFAPLTKPDKYTPQAELRAQGQVALEELFAALGSRSCRVLLRVPLKPQRSYRPNEQAYVLETYMRVPTVWVDYLGNLAIYRLDREARRAGTYDRAAVLKAASAYFSVQYAQSGGYLTVRLDASPEQAKILDAGMERGEVFEEITVRIHGGPREDPRMQRQQEQAMRYGVFTPPLSLVFEEVRLVAKGVVLGTFLPYTEVSAN